MFRLGDLRYRSTTAVLTEMDYIEPNPVGTPPFGWSHGRVSHGIYEWTDFFVANQEEAPF